MDKLFHNIRNYVVHNANYENGVLLVALLIALSLLWNTVGALGRNFELQQQVDTLATEIEILHLENDTLRFQRLYYESSEYIELSARERLGKAAPGEKLIILPKVEEPPETDEVPVSRLASQSNFDQWMYFFFGNKAR